MLYQVIKAAYPNFADRDVRGLSTKVVRDGAYLGRVTGAVSGLDYSFIHARGDEAIDQFFQGLHLSIAAWIEAEVRAGRFRSDWSVDVDFVEFTGDSVLRRIESAGSSLPAIHMDSPVEFTVE